MDAQQPATRVLVVDDDELIRSMLDKALRRLGCQVLQAPDGYLGLQLAELHTPAVIFSDLRMPGFDGHSLLRKLAEGHNRAAVVIMSGAGEMQDVIDSLREGAVDYLRKPWSPTELAAALARALEESDRRVAFQAVRPAAAAAPPSEAGALRHACSPPAGPTPTPPSPAFASRKGPEAPGGGRPRKGSPSPPTPGPPSAASAPPSAVPEPVAAPPSPTPAPAAHGPDAIEERFEALLRGVRSGEVEVPCAPAVLRDLRATIRTSEATVDDVTRLIEKDQRLTAQLLRLSNSPFYARGSRNFSVKAATLRVGMGTVATMAETIFTRGWCELTSPALRAVQLACWRFSVARAVAMRALSSEMRHASLDPDYAYAAGLFADVGASLLVWLAAEHGLLASDEPAERIRFGELLQRHHGEVGSHILESWHSDPRWAQLARAHHASAPPSGGELLWRLELVAADLAQEVTSLDPSAHNPRDATLIDDCSERLGLGHATERARHRLKDEFEAVTSALGQ